MGLLACTSKPQRAPGHESQLHKKYTHTHAQQVTIILCSAVKDVITTASLLHIKSTLIVSQRKGGGRSAEVAQRTYLHEVTAYANRGDRGNAKCERGRWRETERRSERTSMPGQRENTLWKFTEFKELSQRRSSCPLRLQHTHTHTPSRPFCYTWSPLSFLVPPHALTPHSIHRPPKHNIQPPTKHTSAPRYA